MGNSKTPEEAILYLADSKCLACNGYGLYEFWNDHLGVGDHELCPDCLGADGKPTGARFHALRVECPGVGCPYDPKGLEGIGQHHCPTCGNMQLAGYPHLPHDEFCGLCDGLDWVPIAWTDEREIRQALMAGGFFVSYQSNREDSIPGIWTVEPMEGNPSTYFGRESPVLVIAADRAIKAEASNDDLG
jgi:hypothetical protein